MSDETKELLVVGVKTFKITIPADAKVTFGPFSPPVKGEGWNQEKAVGTLRIYRGTKDNIIACFTGVREFRDLSMNYAEEVAREEGAVIWKSDERGYEREEKVQRQTEWVEPVAEIEAPRRRRRS